jgi:hypothetical protein
MTDCAHRLAASCHIRKHLDASHREWLARRESSEAQRSSLLKLALTSIKLHEATLAKGVRPWEDGKGPMSVAVACLATIARNEGV